jgi:hypothetical protein
MATNTTGWGYLSQMDTQFLYLLAMFDRFLDSIFRLLQVLQRTVGSTGPNSVLTR